MNIAEKQCCDTLSRLAELCRNHVNTEPRDQPHGAQ